MYIDNASENTCILVVQLEYLLYDYFYFYFIDWYIIDLWQYWFCLHIADDNDQVLSYGSWRQEFWKRYRCLDIGVLLFPVLFSLYAVSSNIHHEYMFVRKFKQANKFIYVYWLRAARFCNWIARTCTFLQNLSCKFYVCT